MRATIVTIEKGERVNNRSGDVTFRLYVLGVMFADIIISLSFFFFLTGGYPRYTFYLGVKWISALGIRAFKEGVRSPKP